MSRWETAVSTAAQIERKRTRSDKLRVTWNSAVIVAARSGATYGFLTGFGMGGVHALLNGMSLDRGTLLAVLVGVLTSGIVGLAILAYKDGTYPYALYHETEEDYGRPAFTYGGDRPRPLERQEGSRIMYGKVKLSPAQRAALARLVLVAGQDRLSGRVLQEAGVIGDRLAETAPFHEDLIALGFGERVGKTVKATNALAQYLDQFLPPDPPTTGD